jgi:hypothetical protein
MLGSATFPLEPPQCQGMLMPRLILTRIRRLLALRFRLAHPGESIDRLTDIIVGVIPERDRRGVELSGISGN